MRRAYRPKTPEGATNSNYVHFLLGLIFNYDATTGEGMDLRAPTTRLARADAVIEQAYL